MFTFNFLVEAATKNQSSDISMPAMIGLIAGVIVIIVIVIVCNIVGKKKGKELGDKFLAELQAEHPFAESIKGVHFTKDGYLITENYDGKPINKSSSKITRAQKRRGYVAIIYKLSDIKYVSLYAFNVKLVNNYGHGQIISTGYNCAVLDENLKPLYPEFKCTGKLDKAYLKNYEKGDLKGTSLAFVEEKDSVMCAALVKKYAPHVQEVAYEKVEEMAKKR
ncbi:MAG: hypothetical protein J5752_05110 [Clostridiales bacterium]|nr:hypothetical protein [Clostridiales bacterium]